uniref:Uncharacterized protein n=1 Tax=Romanomermis culicivorax TaxID=13658 RepID=A0A915JB16_ROMCU
MFVVYSRGKSDLVPLYVDRVLNFDVLEAEEKREILKNMGTCANFNLKVTSHDCTKRPFFDFKTNFGMPLIRVADSDKAVTRHHEEQLIRRVQLLMFLRQNMEKARNLCYMIERREKLKRQEYTAALEYILKLHDNFTELKFSSSSSSTTSKSTAHRILTDSHLLNTVGFKSPPPPPPATDDHASPGGSDKRHLQQFRGVNSKRVKTPSKLNNKIAEFPPRNHRLVKTTPPEHLSVIKNYASSRPKNFMSSPMNFLRHGNYDHSQNRCDFASNARKRSASTSKMKNRLDRNLVIDAKRQRRHVMPFSASVKSAFCRIVVLLPWECQ